MPTVPSRRSGLLPIESGALNQCAEMKHLLREESSTQFSRADSGLGEKGHRICVAQEAGAPTSVGAAAAEDCEANGTVQGKTTRLTMNGVN